MSFKEEYRKYNEAIRPAKGLVEEMKEEVKRREEDKRSVYLRIVRDGFTAVAACVCIFVGIPTLAANIDPIYYIMYRFSPKLAQQFRLVQTWDEDQGIRMEVAAVYIEGGEIQAYITLQDLEGDRIDETTDLYDSCSILTSVEGFGGNYGGGGYAPVNYDAETGKATFLVMQGQFEGDIQGEKVTFSLREILGKKRKYENLEIPIPWSEVQMSPETRELFINGGSIPNGGSENAAPGMRKKAIYDDAGNLIAYTPARYTDMLLPGEPDSRLSVEGIDFTGMGYIDGMLHIQTAVYDSLSNDNHCELFLVDEAGNLRIYDYKINGFGEADEKGIRTSYQECIFDVTPEELERYTLCGDFTVSGLHVTGHWSVTFPLEQTK